MVQNCLKCNKRETQILGAEVLIKILMFADWNEVEQISKNEHSCGLMTDLISEGNAILQALAKDAEISKALQANYRNLQS